MVDVASEDDSDDKVAESHADGTHGKHGLAAEAVDPKDGWDRSDEHYYADDARGQEAGCVFTKAELLENGGGVVQDLFLISITNGK